MHAGASVLLGALLAASCPLASADPDLVAAARAALEQLDPNEALTIVLPDDASPELAAAVRQIRTAVLRSELAASATESFPRGHLLLERLELEGDEASVSALLGPVPRAKEGEALLACGTRYGFTMTKKRDGWTIGAMSIAVC